MRRRQFLRGGTAVAATAVGGVALAESTRPGAAESRPEREPSGQLLPGTPHATPVYVLEGAAEGPTAVVVGGLHGDEPAGARAAERVADWNVAAGRLVVIPRANQVALRRGTRHGEAGDLNRQFLPEERPATELARAIWDRVTAADPDVLVDLHSSNGIYWLHPDFVGQAVFPTETGDAVSVARPAVEVVNDAVVPWHMPFHDFEVGNQLDGGSPLLAHKVGGDLEEPAYIVEATEFLVDVQTGARWDERVASELLTRHGIEREGGA